MSQVLSAPGDDGDASDDGGAAVRAAAQAVARGDLVVLPTDTVYGVAADAFDPGAVAALLAAKGRGRAMPPPVLVPDQHTLDGLATDVPAYARRLVDRFWPGPLTLVFKAQASLMWDLGDTGGTVAIRMPRHDVALAVLAETGPLAVSSANLSGNPAATTVADARAQLQETVAVYVDGGPCPGALPSTILDCTKDEFAVLRQGALGEQELRAAVTPGHQDERV